MSGAGDPDLERQARQLAGHTVKAVFDSAKELEAGTDAATARLLCQWRGPGGDSLGIGHGAIWLTDYAAGPISRFELPDTIARCRAVPHG